MPTGLRGTFRRGAVGVAGPVFGVLAAFAMAALIGAAGCAHDPRPFVRNVKILGAKNLDAGDLKKKLATQETSFFTVAHKKYFAKSVLEADKKRVEAFYASHGYFSAHVVKTELRPRARNSLDVLITVDEGRETRILERRVTGLERLGPLADRLLRKFKGFPGEIYDHEKYEGKKAQLTQTLRESGYPWATVAGDVQIDRDARTAIIALDVKTGPLARFAEVHVEGSQRVPEKLAIRIADLPVGDTFSPRVLEVARGRLHNLGVFSSVHVEPVKDPAHLELVPVKITVLDDPKVRKLRLGGGVGIEDGRTDAHVRLAISHNDLGGGLRRFDLRFDVGWVLFWQRLQDGLFLPAHATANCRPIDCAIAGVAFGPQTKLQHGPQITVEAKLAQPEIPWHRAQLRASLAYDVGTEFGYEYTGPRATLGVTTPAWQRRLRFGVTYGFQYLYFFNVDPSLTANQPATSSTKGCSPTSSVNCLQFEDYRLGWLQEQAALDLRDNPFDARRGFFLEATLEEGGVWTGGAFTYESIVGDARGYVPLGARAVLAARGMFGHIFVQGKGLTPITRNLYLGGPSSHRGFAYNRLSPQETSGQSNIPIGGTEMALAQLEFRIDFLKLFGQYLALATFVDGGDVVPTGTHVDLTRLHWAVGGGLRYNTVVGAIRFDLGVRLNRLDPQESDGRQNPDPGSRIAFHISIGEAF